jgi:hypothetical protein
MRDNLPGYAIREERRRELLMAMAKSLSWTRAISTADILRTYGPRASVEQWYVETAQRQVQIAALREELARRGIRDPMPELNVTEAAAAGPIQVSPSQSPSPQSRTEPPAHSPATTTPSPAATTPETQVNGRPTA